jgi:hypothetical protein
MWILFVDDQRIRRFHHRVSNVHVQVELGTNHTFSPAFRHDCTNMS